MKKTVMIEIKVRHDILGIWRIIFICLLMCWREDRRQDERKRKRKKNCVAFRRKKSWWDGRGKLELMEIHDNQQPNAGIALDRDDRVFFFFFCNSFFSFIFSCNPGWIMPPWGHRVISKIHSHNGEMKMFHYSKHFHVKSWLIAQCKMSESQIE